MWRGDGRAGVLEHKAVTSRLQHDDKPGTFLKSFLSLIQGSHAPSQPLAREPGVEGTVGDHASS